MSNIESFIVKYDNVLNEKDFLFLQEFIQNIDSLFEDACVSINHSSEFRPEFRKTKELDLFKFRDKPDIVKLEHILYQSFSGILKQYLDKFTIYRTNLRDSGYRILKYEPGCFFIKHSDRGNNDDDVNRWISLVYFIDDSYEGGNLVFFDSYKIEKTKNSAVLFPSNELFQHAVTPVTNGLRHTIVTWFVPH